MYEPMLRPTLVLATVLYLLVALPAIILAPFAGFLFDDGTVDAITYILAGLWFALPITLLTAILGGWLTHVRAKHRAMGIFLLLPIAHAACIVLFGVLHFAR